LKGKQSNKSVHYLSIETLKRNYQGWVNIIVNGKWRRVPIIST
jgi:hypothetical protein